SQLLCFRLKELKDVLGHLGLSKSGKKQVLVGRIEALLSSPSVPFNGRVPTITPTQVAEFIQDTYRSLRSTGQQVDTPVASPVQPQRRREERADRVEGEGVERGDGGAEAAVRADTVRGLGLWRVAACEIRHSAREPASHAHHAPSLTPLASHSLMPIPPVFLTQCEGHGCGVWQHVKCVILPEKPPTPSYCQCILAFAHPSTPCRFQCEGHGCGVWQHVKCVILPENPPLTGDSSAAPQPDPPLPEHHYCELCRMARGDPFSVPVANPMPPTALIRLPGDNNQVLQRLEHNFTLTPHDLSLLRRPHHYLQVRRPHRCPHHYLQCMGHQQVAVYESPTGLGSSCWEQTAAMTDPQYALTRCCLALPDVPKMPNCSAFLACSCCFCSTHVRSGALILSALLPLLSPALSPPQIAEACHAGDNHVAMAAVDKGPLLPALTFPSPALSFPPCFPPPTPTPFQIAEACHAGDNHVAMAAIDKRPFCIGVRIIRKRSFDEVRGVKCGGDGHSSCGRGGVTRVPSRSNQLSASARLKQCLTFSPSPSSPPYHQVMAMIRPLDVGSHSNPPSLKWSALLQHIQATSPAPSPPHPPCQVMAMIPPLDVGESLESALARVKRCVGGGGGGGSGKGGAGGAGGGGGGGVCPVCMKLYALDSLIIDPFFHRVCEEVCSL
ncbi:unnamed protein product, partial [Closterium sp. NIES-65]